MDLVKYRPLTIRFFIVVWVLSFLFISGRDLLDYRLQSIGVDSWVTFGTAEVGLSKSSTLAPAGDVFEHNGKLYPAKQPGQFILGAVFYSVLKMLGCSYESNYLLAAGFIGALTSGLLTAFVAMLMLRHSLVVHSANPTLACLVVASTFIGSQWYVYSSISHHDILAGCLMMIAIVLLDPRKKWPSSSRLFFAGIILGLVLFTSMLPAAMVLVCIVYCMFVAAFVSGRHLWVLMGFCLGLLPIFLYNLIYFGSPLTPANIAGGYSDTYPAMEPFRFLHHLNMYLGVSGLNQFLYSPISYGAILFSILWGLVGFYKLPAALAKVVGDRSSDNLFSIFLTMLCGAVLVHLVYICSIETLGTCSYGPRYLLPILPVVSFILLCKLGQAVKFWGVAALSVFLVYGFCVNLVGKLYGSIVCNLEEFSFLAQLQRAPSLSSAELPLLPLVVFFLAFAGIRLFVFIQSKIQVEVTGPDVLVRNG